MKNKDDKKQQEEEVKKFFEENTQEIELKPLSSDIKGKFEREIKDLEEFKEEINTTQKSFLEKSKELKEQLVSLVRSGKIKLDKAEQEKSDQKIEMYKKFLQGIEQEVNSELNFCKELVSDSPPKILRVFKGGSQDSGQVLENKIKTIKKYIKKSQKDLRVSFSKYDFSLSNQIKNLIYLEAYLKRAKK